MGGIVSWVRWLCDATESRSLDSDALGHPTERKSGARRGPRGASSLGMTNYKNTRDAGLKPRSTRYPLTTIH